MAAAPRRRDQRCHEHDQGAETPLREADDGRDDAREGGHVAPPPSFAAAFRLRLSRGVNGNGNAGTPSTASPGGRSRASRPRPTAPDSASSPPTTIRPTRPGSTPSSRFSLASALHRPPAIPPRRHRGGRPLVTRRPTRLRAPGLLLARRCSSASVPTPLSPRRVGVHGPSRRRLAI